MLAVQKPPSFLYFCDCVHVEIDDDDEVVEDIRNIKTINRRCGGDSMETIKGSMRPNVTNFIQLVSLQPVD